MTYIITPPNRGVPLKLQPGTTGRVVKEDDSQINIANWIQEVSTPGSGVNLNIDASSMSVVVEQDEGNVLRRIQNGRELFQADFGAGLDTLNKFHLMYNGTLKTPGEVNASATGGVGSVNEVNFDLGFLETTIDYNGAPGTNQWIAQSQIPMKMRDSENTYLLTTGRFRNSDAIGALDIRITSREALFGDDAIEQTNWNINTMDGAVSPSNPSGVTLDLDKINTLVVAYPLKVSGNVKFGFSIGNEVIYAHEFFTSNMTSSLPGLTNKPVRIEGDLIGVDQSNLKVGLFDNISGYFLEIRSTGSVGPLFTSQFYSAGCFGVGANRNEFYRTFPVGNEDGPKPVGLSKVPLVSIKPKTEFPPSASPIFNNTIISLLEINISGSSQDENDALFIEVIANQELSILTGPDTFISVDPDSSVNFNVAATGTVPGGKQIYANTIYPNKENRFQINMGKVLSNFINQYANSRIEGSNLPPAVNKSTTITVIANRVLAGPNILVSATIVWAEKP